jgi:hypothetical protein
MIRRAVLASVLLVLATAGLASRTHAATFDLIYADQMNVTLCPNGCGITVTGDSYALIVNKGATDIGAAELFGTTFSCTSSRPEMALVPFVNNPGPPVAPIHPNEAVGSAVTAIGLLAPLLQAGETLRNTAPLQVLAFEIERVGTNNYAGPVAFQVSMTTGANVAHFTILANVTLGGPSEFAFSYTHAARVSSIPIATPVRATTWGAIKTLYR